ncbi:MAG: CRP/FNR family cyclic AMP-dependent transcriptional regulator [Gammaproteobacteria bacterium]|jgi:CRP/FNR family cyclic AMP-dependent transcriptional regulator
MESFLKDSSMRQVTRDEYPIESLHRIVNGVTFFKELILTDPAQFELLMSVTRFMVADQDELIFHKDDRADILYFLLKGQLVVFADDEANTLLGEVNAGEPFGVMAMLLNFRRSASIRVSGRQALLAGIDFAHFRHDQNASLFDVGTRIRFFRMIDNHIRWALERNKIAEPEHPLVPRLRSLPIYTGEKDTVAELHALMHLAHVQAELLRDWNESTLVSTS